MALIARGRTVLRDSAHHWVDNNGPTMGAALAFYCAFSLTPLLVILVTALGWIVGTDFAYGYLGSVLRELFGAGSSGLLLDAVRSSQGDRGVLAITLSIVTLVVGATSVFAALRTALGRIWDLRIEPSANWRQFLHTRLLSFGFILAMGFLLLVSLSLTTALTALRSYVAERFTWVVVLTGVMDFFLSLLISGGLIALIFRYMPARRLPWSIVLRGAAVTAVLFHVGRWAIGLYLGKATQASAFGAAASFVALLLWLYYSAQIFLFGAEVTASLGRARSDSGSDESGVCPIAHSEVSPRGTG
jgi:membrane protein